jgi:hypothetical protein
MNIDALLTSGPADNSWLPRGSTFDILRNGPGRARTMFRRTIPGDKNFRESLRVKLP